MTVDDIKHLGALSRLALTDHEAAAFSKEIDAILEYVGVVTTIAGDGALEKKVGIVHNVLREDVVTVPSGAYTDAILAGVPKRHGQFVEVKKIIAQDE